MADRINAEPQPRAPMLWTATYLLMGLRFSNEFAYQLLEGVQNMQESTTYQAILKEGRNEGRNEGLIEGRVTEAVRMLLMLGEARFGKPDEATRTAVKATHDLERLERSTRRVIDTNVHDWNGLLGMP
jgi:predicted transposase YdaD